jgi:hypothetical protein
MGDPMLDVAMWLLWGLLLGAILKVSARPW